MRSHFQGHHARDEGGEDSVLLGEMLVILSSR